MIDVKPIKICFISLRSYPLFAEKSKEYFGGAEVQISLVTQELAKDKRFIVSIITGDYDQAKVVSQGRLKLYKTKLFDFFKILKTVDADVYVERTVNPKVCLVGWWCRLFKKKFVYMVAHDWDTINRWLYYFGLKGANLIITQSQIQKKNLLKNFQLNSIVIPSLASSYKTKGKHYEREFILWVGRADKWKRPLSFINLAKKFPREKFIMICRQGNDKKLFDKIKRQARLQPNLKFLPAVPIEEMVKFFQKAKVFVNTSIAEGFPNTFLQAGLTETPVFSYQVNPDDYLNQYHCGLVGPRRFEQLLNHPARLKIMGQNHYNYVKTTHTLTNLTKLKRALRQLVQY